MIRFVVTPRDAYMKGYLRGIGGGWWAITWFDWLNPFHGEEERKLQTMGFHEGMRDLIRNQVFGPPGGNGGSRGKHPRLKRRKGRKRRRR